MPADPLAGLGNPAAAVLALLKPEPPLRVGESDAEFESGSPDHLTFPDYLSVDGELQHKAVRDPGRSRAGEPGPGIGYVADRARFRAEAGFAPHDGGLLERLARSSALFRAHALRPLTDISNLGLRNA
jgi:hypothetical protein